MAEKEKENNLNKLSYREANVDLPFMWRDGYNYIKDMKRHQVY